MPTISPEQKQRIRERWLALTLATYPDPARRFLASERDRFRNPVGQTLKENIFLLAEELFGAMDAASVRQALSDLVRLRAVENFTPREAVAFVFLLKPVLQEELASDPGLRLQLENRIDEMALTAFDLFAQCRERIHEVQARELRRREGVREKIHAGAEGR